MGYQRRVHGIVYSDKYSIRMTRLINITVFCVTAFLLICNCINFSYAREAKMMQDWLKTQKRIQPLFFGEDCGQGPPESSQRSGELSEEEWDMLRTSCCHEWFPDVSDRITDPGLLVAFRACRGYL